MVPRLFTRETEAPACRHRNNCCLARDTRDERAAFEHDTALHSVSATRREKPRAARARLPRSLSPRKPTSPEPTEPSTPRCFLVVRACAVGVHRQPRATKDLDVRDSVPG